MKIRSYTLNDYKEAWQIWYTFFRDEFDFPDFFKAFHCVFTIENNNEPVVIGGVRPIAELVAITNKDASTRDRVIGLKTLVEACKFVCAEHNYDQLHCFVQGDKWSRQVQTVHFKPTKGQSLYIDI